MTAPLLQTKLYIPPPRPELVPRPRLIERLNAGLGQSRGSGRKLTLVSAPAGFGKTTLVSEWVSHFRLEIADSGLETTSASAIDNRQSAIRNRVAWLSLDESDNDLARFLSYSIAALQTIDANIGRGALAMLQSPQSPPVEVVLTILINQIAAISDQIVLILDDYHLIEAQPIHDALMFLLRHLPPGMHLVIATREDPPLPLARLRARGRLTELRATDLRFTSSEAAAFLNQAMGLDLSAEDIAALESRTEGWVAGLQLAAISMRGREDVTGFIRSFAGSHHFVMDYLVDEVLEQQSQRVQTFLLHTSILDRLTGSLCDALTGEEDGQTTLEMLEHANLFIVPLDDERRWYRYHHFFADLLRQRLCQSGASPTGDEGRHVDELHARASMWYEENGLEIEAFHHAAAANDIERTERLMEGDGMPLPFRGAVAPVLNWLKSLPTTVLDARPLLWVTYASTLLASGQPTGVEQKLQAAEAALGGAEPDDKTRDLVGRIAATRATLAVGQHQIETTIAQSRRALEYLHPDNLAFRTFTTWKLGYAYHLQGDRAAAKQGYTEAISISQASGNMITTIVATIGLGSLQEAENQLYLAAETYRYALQLLGDQPLPVACEAHLGLARIFYQWNDLDAAQQHGQQSLQLARQTESIDTFATCGVFLACLRLAQGDVSGADAILAEAEQFVRQHTFVFQIPDVAAAQVLALLYRGNLAEAAQLAEKHELPLSRARVHLAQGDTSAALVVLGPWRQQVEAKGWQDERLKVLVLQALAHHAHGEKEVAAQLLGDALALAEPGGFIRTFVDEGPPMARLLYEALTRGIAPDYVRRLLAAFPVTEPGQPATPAKETTEAELIEPLSERELEVLQLLSEGLTNSEIAARLFLALNTVKSHSRNIYGKLGVHSRMRAVARARALGLLPST